jgi:hypothetical protein
MSTSRVWIVPQDQVYPRLRERFQEDSLLAPLTINNWLRLASMDYRNETLQMYALPSDVVFMAPVQRLEYHVIMPVGQDFRASFSAYEFGLLGTLLAYRELKSVAACFERDFNILRAFAVDLERFYRKRLISVALERSANPSELREFETSGITSLARG